MTVATLQAIPEGVAAPVLRSATPTTLSLQWSEPFKPNGVITKYILTVHQENIRLFSLETEGSTEETLNGKNIVIMKSG